MRVGAAPGSQPVHTARGRQRAQVPVCIPTSVEVGQRSGSRAIPVMPDIRGPDGHVMRPRKGIWHDRHSLPMPMVKGGHLARTSEASPSLGNRRETGRLDARNVVGVGLLRAGALGLLRIPRVLGELHTFGPIVPS